MSQLAMELKAQQDIELLREQLSVAASEILALRSANKECVEYFNEAQKDLAAANTEIERLKTNAFERTNQLIDGMLAQASIQAREQQLREALDAVQQVANRSEGIAGWHLNGNLASWDELLPEVYEALALPQDTSALEAVVTKACEVMRERCLSEIDPKYYTHDLLRGVVEGCCGDLRALPGVTLEDLK